DGILFHHLLTAKGDPYLHISSLAFADRKRLDAYMDAFQKVVDRHDIFRTAFVWESMSTAAQVVWRKAQVKLQELSLDAAKGPVIDQMIQRFDPVHHRIDLTQASLYHFAAAQDADGTWLLVQLKHHMVGDHSTEDEMNLEIQALLEGHGNTLSEPKPFRNLIAQARLGVSIEAQEQFFSQMLGDFDTPSLPYGITEVHSNGEDIFESTRLLSQECNDRMRGIARQLGVSLASLCHLAWAQVIARTSGQKRVVFGTVLLGRMAGGSGADRAMGLYINTLPFRVDVEDTSVLESVRKTQSDLAALLEHEQASLVLAQKCSNVMAGMPLFSSILNYRHNTSQSNSALGIPGIRFLGEKERTNYPFSLSVEDGGTTLGLTAQAVQPYDADRLCAYMQEALESLAYAIERTSSVPVQDMSVLPAAERKLLLETWNDTTIPCPEDKCIHHLFEQHVEKYPQNSAVVYGDQELTYHELNERANSLAYRLIELGVRPDVRVAICADRSIAFMVAIMAVMKAGGAYVPMDPTFASERLCDILSDSGPVLLLADKAGVAALGTAVPESMTVLDPNTVLQYPTTNPQVPGLTPRNLAYVIYTSGSTGKPKGVMVEHQGLVNLAMTRPTVFGVTPTTRFMLFFSFSFDGSVCEWLPALSWGGAVHVLSDQVRHDRDQVWAYFDKHSITQAILTPSVLQDCNGLLPLKTNLRLILAGEALPPSLLRKLKTLIPNGCVVNDYGPTETCVSAIAWFCPEDYSNEIVPIGRPIGNKRAYLLDSRGVPVPMGVVGELYIGGAGIARGYLNRPDLTAKAFLPDPFANDKQARMYRTGDLARYLPSGQLVYMGRDDHQVKIRGYRIELGEIEARLVEHELVSDAVVLALGEGSNKRLVAYVVTVPKEGLAFVLRTHVASKLPEYMVPAAYVRLDALPLTANGKLDRRALPEPDSGAFATQEYEAPVGKTEEALAAVWAELLSLDRIGRHDNFFMLGGHSLLAVQMIERL
ncbi:hypothetical protein BGZ54_003918, partial [Gamsiella multidivaricata]